MARFYFDHQEEGGELRKDEEGTELPNLAAARLEAARTAAEWTKDHGSPSGAKLMLIVRDGSPRPLFVVKAGIEFADLTGK
jgi:hypothetical protein